MVCSASASSRLSLIVFILGSDSALPELSDRLEQRRKANEHQNHQFRLCRRASRFPRSTPARGPMFRRRWLGPTARRHQGVGPDLRRPGRPDHEPWVHWVIYKIPADLKGLPEGVARKPRLKSPAGALQGQNSWPKGQNIGYRGPMPPPGHGVHHYRFTLYALEAQARGRAGPGQESHAPGRSRTTCWPKASWWERTSGERISTSGGVEVSGWDDRFGRPADPVS